MRAADPPFGGPAVAAAFAAFPGPSRRGLLTLRRLIFDVAAATPGVGRLDETLKWGQPAYLTPETGSGSTLRLGLPKTGGFAVYAHCRTTIIPDFQALFPDDFTYEAHRAVHFPDAASLRPDKLEWLIRRALTYHRKGPRAATQAR